MLWILYLMLGFFTVVGMVNISMAVARWLCGPGDAADSRHLLVVVRGYDPCPEMNIRQAKAAVDSGHYDRTATRLAVVCQGADSETLETCSRLCADLDLPLLLPAEVEGYLAGETLRIWNPTKSEM